MAWATRFIALLLVGPIAGPVMAQPAIEMLGGDSQLLLSGTLLPQDTARDFSRIGRGQFDPAATIYGFEQPLDPTVFDATQNFFNPDSAAQREIGRIQLEHYAPQFPEINVILGAAEAPEVATDPIGALSTGALDGSWVAQQALNIQYLETDILQPERFDALKFDFERGENPGFGAALALQYQYGIGIEADPAQADVVWQSVIGQSPNALNVYSYANFLEQQGRLDEASQYYDMAPDFAPAVANNFQLARTTGDLPKIYDLLPSLDSLAEKDRKAALVAGQYREDLGRDMPPGPQRTAMLQAALEKYRQALTTSSGPPIFMARAMSAIAEMYREFPEIRPDVWEDELRVLFNEAARLGDAGGFLGLARLARDGGDSEQAYALASRAADLGNPDQIKAARAILREVCQPGAWSVTCAPVPVFFVTTRIIDPSSPTSFGGADSSQFRPSFGLAFVQVPLLSGNYAARQALFEAAQDVVAGLAGQSGLDRLASNPELAVFIIPTGDAWASATRQVATAIGADDAFAFVHGYNVAFDAALRTTAETVERASFPSLPIALSWPSEGDLLDYGKDAGRVQMACPRLFEGLKQIGAVFGGEHITLMAHSMGAHVVYQMVNGCDGLDDSRWPYQPIANLIYAAPDMPRLTFEEKIEPQTTQRAAHTTLYVTSNDAALALSASAAVNAEIRAGQNPPDTGPVVSPRLVTVDATEAETSWVGLLTGNTNHGYVFTQPQVVADLGQLLNLEYDPLARTCLKKAKATPDYWRIRGDCAIPGN